MKARANVIGSPEIVFVSRSPRVHQLCTALRNDSIAAVVLSSYSDATRVLAANPGSVCVIDSELPPDMAGEVATLALRSQTRRTVILADADYCEQARKSGLPIGVDLCPWDETVEETVIHLKGFMLLAGFHVASSLRLRDR